MNLRDERGRDLFCQLVEISDVVTENFAAGVMERLGLGYDDLRSIRPDIIYVSNSGFGATGPYSSFKSWGPIVQAQCGLTGMTGLAGQPPAGIGYSYMDHHGAYFMAAAILAAVLHRSQSGEGQWIDMACIEAGALLCGPSVLDASVNGREHHFVDSNRGDGPLMVPHGIYPAAGDDEWVAIACREDADWSALQSVVAIDWVHEAELATVAGRARHRDEIDRQLAKWTSERSRFEVWQAFREVGVPAAAVLLPAERVDDDEARAWGLWPTVTHGVIGEVRVDGIPVHLSETDWEIRRGAPQLGEHNRQVLGGLLGLDDERLRELLEDGVL